MLLINTNDGTSLSLAFNNGHVDVAKVLIQNGADVNAVDKWKGRHFTGSLSWTC